MHCTQAQAQACAREERCTHPRRVECTAVHQCAFLCERECALCCAIYIYSFSTCTSWVLLGFVLSLRKRGCSLKQCTFVHRSSRVYCTYIWCNIRKSMCKHSLSSHIAHNLSLLLAAQQRSSTATTRQQRRQSMSSEEHTRLQMKNKQKLINYTTT